MLECVECVRNKNRRKTTGVVFKPICSENFNIRGQMDLIDMQTLPDSNNLLYKFFSKKC